MANIFDLSRDDFMFTLDELGLPPDRRDELIREYRRQNSVFAPINRAADNRQAEIAGEGRRPVAGGLLSKPEGATGMDALRGLRLEPMNAILGLLAGTGQAIDAPAAAAQGLIPEGDMVAEALGTGGLAMGGGGLLVGPRRNLSYDPNTLNIFAGPNSRTADLDALSRARELSARRRSPEEVWRETGWFKGADGKWRYEIDDSQMRLDQDIESGWGVRPPTGLPEDRLAEARSLAAAGQSDFQIYRATGYMRRDGDFEDYGPPDQSVSPVSHGPLASAYNLDDLLISQQPLLADTGYAGSYDPFFRTASGDTGRIDYLPGTNDPRSVVLHELQHAIQHREGFLPGGSIDGGDVDAYRGLAGEVEARNVQARMDFTPEQRRSIPPWATQDTPYDQQILSANRSTPVGLLALSAEPRNAAERMAREILDLRAAGRAGEVTEEMMAQADPQYMFDNTPLPMDEASRLARAREMGFDTGLPLYHGTDAWKIDAFDPGKGMEGLPATFFSDSRDVAGSYGDVGEYFSRVNYPAEFDFYGGSRINFNNENVTPGGLVRQVKQVVDNTARYGADTESDLAFDLQGANVDPWYADEIDAVKMRNVVDSFGWDGSPANNLAIFDPTKIRRTSARFDPEFAHLSNLNAANASPLLGLLAMMAAQEQRNGQ